MNTHLQIMLNSSYLPKILFFWPLLLFCTVLYYWLKYHWRIHKLPLLWQMKHFYLAFIKNLRQWEAFNMKLWISLGTFVLILRSSIFYSSSVENSSVCLRLEEERWVLEIKLSSWLFMEKARAPHSSTLAWKIPWMEEPGRLQSMGSLRVGLDLIEQLQFHFHFHALEKARAPHSSPLA